MSEGDKLVPSEALVFLFMRRMGRELVLTHELSAAINAMTGVFVEHPDLFMVYAEMVLGTINGKIGEVAPSPLKRN